MEFADFQRLWRDRSSSVRQTVAELIEMLLRFGLSKDEIARNVSDVKLSDGSSLHFRGHHVTELHEHLTNKDPKIKTRRFGPKYGYAVLLAAEAIIGSPLNLEAIATAANGGGGVSHTFARTMLDRATVTKTILEHLREIDERYVEQTKFRSAKLPAYVHETLAASIYEQMVYAVELVRNIFHAAPDESAFNAAMNALVNGNLPLDQRRERIASIYNARLVEDADQTKSPISDKRAG